MKRLLAISLGIIALAVIAAQPAEAGHYAPPVYSGGGWYLDGMIGSYTQQFYNGQNYWGIDLQGTQVVRCEGEIVSYFQWVPDYPGEPHPNVVWFHEDVVCTASGASPSLITPSNFGTSNPPIDEYRWLRQAINWDTLWVGTIFSSNSSGSIWGTTASYYVNPLIVADKCQILPNGDVILRSSPLAWVDLTPTGGSGFSPLDPINNNGVTDIRARVFYRATVGSGLL